jgi:cyanophycinase
MSEEQKDDGQQRPHGIGRGTLIIIGGHEDKEGSKTILRDVARHVGKGRLVVTTVASHEPEGYFPAYEKAFGDLGVRDVVELEIPTRLDAGLDDKLHLLDGATGVFFTGGDQLKITSQIGGTELSRRIRDVYEQGGVIAGTSAGASVMCETMLVQGHGSESHRIGDLRMAPGLGLIHDVIIDQHFAERGRMGRLLGAVAHNPRVLGIGIDENTAIVIEGGESGPEDACFYVTGHGAVYVVDGTGVTNSNIAEEKEDRTLSIYDVRLHVLSRGDEFNLRTRRPAEIPLEHSERMAANSRGEKAAS